MLLLWVHVRYLRKGRIKSRLKATSVNLSDADARALDAMALYSWSGNESASCKESANVSTVLAKYPVRFPSYSVTISNSGPADLCATGINPAAYFIILISTFYYPRIPGYLPGIRQRQYQNAHSTLYGSQPWTWLNWKQVHQTPHWFQIVHNPTKTHLSQYNWSLDPCIPSIITCTPRSLASCFKFLIRFSSPSFRALPMRTSSKSGVSRHSGCFSNSLANALICIEWSFSGLKNKMLH